MPIDLEDACKRYGASVLRRCTAILGDRDEAQDAAQEVFVMLMRKGDQIRDRDAVASWVYRLATNHCLNQLRARGRRGARETNDVVVGWQDKPCVDPYADYSARQLLTKITATLDPLNQQIFVYRYLDGMTQQEIATMTSKSRRTVGKRLNKIESHLERLREQLR